MKTAKHRAQPYIMLEQAIPVNSLRGIGDLPPEVRVVLLAAPNISSTASNISLIEHLADTLDWPRLLTWASFHRVLPLLYQTLKQLDSQLLPDYLLKSVAQTVNTNTFKNLTLTHQLLDLIIGLAQAGILAIPFKGPVLAQMAYGNVALRNFSDLDIWVAPKDIYTTQKWLQAQGFESRRRLQWECLFKHPQTGLHIDLHYAVTSNKFPFELTFETVASRLQPLKLAGQSIQQLSPEDTLLVQCVGWCKDAWARNARLAQLCDVAEVIRAHLELDWDYVMRQSQALNANYMVFLPLALAYDWLQVPLPKTVLALIQTPLLEQLKNYASQQFWQYALSPQAEHPSPFTRDHGLYFKLRPNPIDLTSYLLKQIFTATEKERRLFLVSERLSWIYTPLRLARLSMKYGKHLLISKR